MEVVDIDLLMLQGRFLFTIKEDEREERGSPDDDDKWRFSANREANRIDEVKRFNRVKLAERFKADEDTVVELDTGGGRHDGATPYSTPSSSPLYFTPSASPIFDVAGGRVTEEIGIGFQ
ncbi:hypothetical protein PHJA_002761300 [Phtheirospermum japonicum]|uniref:Uncharacterized protein n=1 Tax=Phtheirospermum japonicum TaxID=374723 RepID=A0A830D6C0_9LAMI|nr:hypothetical protein PHJA_002761300 [Phtheirospermum japonicum]